MDIHSDRRFHFDVERSEVWAAIACLERYQQWWPWLHEFDGPSFDEGTRWRCVVKPPLPYTLRFEVALVEVIVNDLVRARITGDIRGWAELTAVDHGSGCEIRLVSGLSPASGALRLVARIARPVAAFGHDWILDTGARQFRKLALDR